MVKSLLTLAAVGIATTTLATNTDAKGYGARSEVKTSYKTDAFSDADRQARIAKAKVLIAEFDQKRTIKSHRAAQKAVNFIIFDKEDKKLLQNRINMILKQGLKK